MHAEHVFLHGGTSVTVEVIPVASNGKEIDDSPRRPRRGSTISLTQHNRAFCTCLVSDGLRSTMSPFAFHRELDAPRGTDEVLHVESLISGIRWYIGRRFVLCSTGGFAKNGIAEIPAAGVDLRWMNLNITFLDEYMQQTIA